MSIVGANVWEISAILDAPELICQKTSIQLQNRDIRFEHVGFSCNEEGGEILQGIDMVIRPGTETTLREPSGSGKSTIAEFVKACRKAVGWKLSS